MACGLSLIPLLLGYSAVPLHLALALQILGGLEELLIIYLVPWHEGELRTVWHALKLRRQRAAAKQNENAS